MTRTIRDDWYRDSFGETYLDVYFHRDCEEAEGFISTILDHYRPPPGGVVFDVACGTGRHARSVAGRGYRVVGVDLSLPLLSRAHQTPAQDSGGAGTVPGEPRLLLLQADIRSLPYPVEPGRADLVLNLFTSFGYFPADEENRLALEAMAAVALPGGKLVLDFLNRPYVIRNHVPEDERYRDGVSIRQMRRLTDGAQRIEKTITVHYADDRIENHFESVRLYDRDDLDRMLRRSGMEPLSWWGDYQATPHHAGSPRCIVISQKV
jgi:SAM-dependent methyltransferase